MVIASAGLQYNLKFLYFFLNLHTLQTEQYVSIVLTTATYNDNKESCSSTTCASKYSHQTTNIDAA